MSSKDIILMIFDKLYDVIKFDSYFKALKNIAIEDAEGTFISFKVQQRIYDKLDNKELKKYIEVSRDPEMVLRYSLDIPDGILFFTIKYVDNLLFIELKKSLSDKVVSTVYTKFPTLARVETIEISKNKGFYEDYNCNIYYYDANFNLVSGSTEEEQDIVFSEEFKIPIEMARLFRLNFKKYAKEISRYVAKKNMENLDKQLEDKDFYEFLEPFYLDEFADFINREYSKGVSEDFNILYSETGKDFSIYNNEFDSIVDNLKAQIGTDGEVVISSNIYQNLIMALLGIVADGISTKGFIIKKVNDTYIMYIVYISNDEVIILPKEKTSEEVKEIYEANPKNKEVVGLSEFFNINRSR